MKKYASFILVLMLMISMFTGCGNGGASSSTGESSGGDSASGTEPAGGVEGEVSGSMQITPAAAAMPAIPKEDIKVGVIHIGDPADGSGYSYGHDIGIVEMQNNLGLEDSQIIRKNSVNDADPTMTENAMRECIEEGANIIFATSFGYMDTCEALAEEFPDVIFCHASGYKSNSTNFSNYFGRIYQARYLSGIVAGLKTQTNKLGYVAAMGKENAEVTGGLNAFAMGAASVNPDAEVYVKVTNSWLSPTEETNAAIALIAEGCDIIAQHCDTANPQLEAEKAGIWGIGYNSDMSKDAPNATLTSVMWDWGVYYTKSVQAAIDGTWTSEIYFGGMDEEFVYIEPLNEDLIAEGTAEAVEAARNQIVSKGFNVFDGEIETNEGTIVGSAGSTLDDATITGGINWYYKNVTLK